MSKIIGKIELILSKVMFISILIMSEVKGTQRILRIYLIYQIKTITIYGIALTWKTTLSSMDSNNFKAFNWPTVYTRDIREFKAQPMHWKEHKPTLICKQSILHMLYLFRQLKIKTKNSYYRKIYYVLKGMIKLTLSIITIFMTEAICL